MESKNAIGNLTNRYKAVLKKCNLLNIFGSLAMASMLVVPSLALADNPSGTTLNTTQEITAETQSYTNNGTISIENVPPSSRFIGIYGNESFAPSVGGVTEGYSFTNSATGIINVGGVANSSGSGSGGNSLFDTVVNPNALESNQLTLKDLIEFENELLPYYLELAVFSDAEQQAMTDKANEILKKLGSEDVLESFHDYSEGQNQLANALKNLLIAQGLIQEGELDFFDISKSEFFAYFLPESDLRTVLIDGKNLEFYGMLIGNSQVIDNSAEVEIDPEGFPVPLVAIPAATPTNHLMTNAGRISVNGFGDFVGGMAIFAEGNQAIINSGTTNVYSFFGSAGGLIAYSPNDGNHTVINEGGELNVHVANLYGVAHGIHAYSSVEGSHNISNDSGVLNVLVDNSISPIWINEEGLRTDRVDNYVVGIYASSREGAHSVSNIGGNISVTNNMLNGDAVGIYLNGDLPTGERHSVTSTGFITPQANGAGRQFEVYGDQDYYVENYAITMRVTDPAANRPQYSATDAIFGAAHGAEVHFSENTTIIVRPEVYTHNGVQYYTEVNTNAYNNYVPLGTLISTFDGIEKYVQGDFYINGIIGSENFVTEVPFLIIDAPDIIFADSSPSSLDTNQPSFRLLMNTDNLPTSYTLTAASAIASQLYNAYVGLKPTAYYLAISPTDTVADSGMSGMPAGSHSVMAADMMPSPWSVFGTINGSYTDNSQYNFDSRSFGASGGANYAFSEQLSLGFHFDYSYTDTNSVIAAGSTLDSDMNSVAFGLHSSYFINDNLYVRAMASGAYTASDLDYAASSTIKTTSEAHSATFFAAVATGYAFEINQNNFITPEIGLSYLYTDTSDYAFNFAAPNNMYNMRMHSSSFDALYLNALLTWEGRFVAGSGTLLPSIGVGISQNLMGSDVDSSITVLGNTYTTMASQDSTSFMANASLEWRNGNFSVSAGYDGTFGSDQQRHAGSLNAMYRF